ncbi:MAG: HNH endonuclease [Pseudomonadota bacterium]
MITQKQLKEVLSYDPDTGTFIWKQSRGGRLKGSVAGAIREDGYNVIYFQTRRYYAHRLAWLYVYGCWPKNMIDHRNGVRSDNRIKNLRDVTNQENQHNQRKASRNSSHGYLGCSPNGRRWQAHIKVNGYKKYLGLFKTPQQAHEAYMKAKKELHPTSERQ